MVWAADLGETNAEYAEYAENSANAAIFFVNLANLRPQMLLLMLLLQMRIGLFVAYVVGDIKRFCVGKL